MAVACVTAAGIVTVLIAVFGPSPERGPKVGEAFLIWRAICSYSVQGDGARMRMLVRWSLRPASWIADHGMDAEAVAAAFDHPGLADGSTPVPADHDTNQVSAIRELSQIDVAATPERRPATIEPGTYRRLSRRLRLSRSRAAPGDRYRSLCRRSDAREANGHIRRVLVRANLDVGIAGRNSRGGKHARFICGACYSIRMNPGRSRASRAHWSGYRKWPRRAHEN